MILFRIGITEGILEHEHLRLSLVSFIDFLFRYLDFAFTRIYLYKTLPSMILFHRMSKLFELLTSSEHIMLIKHHAIT